MFNGKKSVRVTRPRTENIELLARDDLGCGVRQCMPCHERAHSDSYAPCLDAERPILMPDVDTLQTHVSIFENADVTNILLLSSVLTQLKERSKHCYVRVKKFVEDPLKNCFIFANEFHSATQCTRKDQEGIEEFELRRVRIVAAWYSKHLSHFQKCQIHLVSSNDRVKDLVDRDVIVSSMRQAIGVLLGDASDVVASIMEPTSNSSQNFETCTAHLSRARLEEGVRAGEFISGKFKASDGSCFFGDIRGGGKIISGVTVERVLLAGRTRVNRAVHGDLVAVQPLPWSDWRPPQNFSGVAPTNAAEALANGFQATGQVVGILEMARRPFCGSIVEGDAEMASGLSGNVSVLVQPKAQRIPKIRISTANSKDLRSKRITVLIDSWPENSVYPFGHLIEVLGDIGDKDTEATVILIENDIPHYDFSQAVYDCLPKGSWSVEPEEEARRKDLRSLTICSVDPLGCKDIDDALHCRVLPTGRTEVGVHIADVTHFMKPGTAMDEEARKRCTSVYLVDRRINMLPQLLTENLCSIVGNEDRYAFSAIWEFEEGSLNPVSEWFGKSIIRSSAALYYGDAQRMIDDSSDKSELAESLRGLMKLSKQLKASRIEAGALELASQEFKFKIDNDHVNPTDMTSYQTFETNSMVEEWMLYANVAAARRIYASFPNSALLRRHQPPGEHAFDTLNEALVAKNHSRLDARTSKTLNESLNRVLDLNDPFFNKLVRILTTRCLRQAQYFSGGEIPYDEFLHYGLAMPIYTHFTSPIRRYADVVVHRQLAALTGYEVNTVVTNAELVKNDAQNINYRHEQAQKAGRDSQNLFTGFFMRNFPDGRIPSTKGYVIRKTDSHVSIFAAKYGQEGRVPLDALKKEYKIFDPVLITVKLMKEGDVMGVKLQFSIDEDEGESERATKVRRVE